MATIDTIRGLAAVLKDPKASHSQKSDAIKNLGKISINNDEIKKAIIQNSGMEAIVNYAKENLGDSSIVKRAAWALQSLTTLEEARSRAMSCGTYRLAVDILRKPSTDDAVCHAKSYAGNLLASLAAGDLQDPSRDSILEIGAAPLLVDLLSSKLLEARAHASHALRNLSYGNADRVRKVMEAGAAPLLVRQVESGAEIEQERASRALWNLAFSEEARPTLVAAGAVDVLDRARMNNNPQTRQNATVAYALLMLGSSRFSLAGAGSPNFEDDIEMSPYIQKFMATEFGAVPFTSYEASQQSWSDPERIMGESVTSSAPMSY